MEPSENKSDSLDCQETFGSKFAAKRRLVSKNGSFVQADIHRRRHCHLGDIFGTIIDTKWRYILLVFLSWSVLSSLLFGLVWWFILSKRGDFSHIGDEDWIPCVDGVVNLLTALLFSFGTQNTLGYGSRALTSKCPEAIILMMIQSAVGTLMAAILTGIVFSKIQRLKRRSETITFSKKAVVCMREGKLCLLFRVGNMRHEHMIGTRITAIKVKNGVTKKDEVFPLFQQDVALHVPSICVPLQMCPVMACHIIDKNSPFYSTSKDDLKHDKFELIVMMEGTVESTGMLTQVRTSYLPSEILWGHRLRRLSACIKKKNDENEIRYFHSSVPVDTPSCSARKLNKDSSSTLHTMTYQSKMRTPRRSIPTRFKIQDSSSDQ